MMREGEQPPDEHDHSDAVAAALAQLSDESKFILMAIFYEQIPYEELGQRLGVSKTHAWRLTNKAKEELKGLLARDPVLTRRYKLYTTWDDACEAVVDSFIRTSAKSMGDVIAWARTNLIDAWEHDFEPSGATFWGLATVAALEFQAMGFPASGVTAFLIGKQHDYGHKNISTFGLKGVIVRLVDKLARLENLQQRDNPSNESIEDTWLDIFGYCVVGTMLLDGTFTLPLKEDANG